MHDVMLNVSEIFFSIQGESSYSGLPFIFIRLTGCNLRCSYCDTTFAYKGGAVLSIDDILETINKYPSKYVEITGGEPLMQDNALILIDALVDEGYKVLLETNGSIDISKVNKSVTRIIDIKCPDSNEGDSFHIDNINYLKKDDEIKFVISSPEDYYFAKKMINDYNLLDKCSVIISNANEDIPLSRISSWILTDGIPVRLQIQLHKHIYGDVKGV